LVEKHGGANADDREGAIGMRFSLPSPDLVVCAVADGELEEPSCDLHVPLTHFGEVGRDHCRLVCAAHTQEDKEQEEERARGDENRENIWVFTRALSIFLNGGKIDGFVCDVADLGAANW